MISQALKNFNREENLQRFDNQTDQVDNLFFQSVLFLSLRVSWSLNNDKVFEHLIINVNGEYEIIKHSF